MAIDLPPIPKIEQLLPNKQLEHNISSVLPGMGLYVFARRPLDQYTSLMLHCDGANTSTTFTDSSWYEHTVTPSGNAQIDTSQSKFGGASAKFNGGTADMLTIPSDASLTFGTDQFTVEFWSRFDQVNNTYRRIVGTSISTYSGGSFSFRQAINGWFQLYYGTSNRNIPFGITVGQWYHIAITRNASNVMKCWIDGTEYDSFTATTNITEPFRYIGGQYSGGEYFSGNLDEIRVSKGIARYTTAFTPPTSPFY